MCLHLTFRITDPNSNQTAFTYDAFGRVRKTNFPSALSETYQYDADNNLTQKTDRKNQTINYVYDALNRLTKKQYPDSTEVDYVYDLVGKVLSVNDPTGTYAFAYDNMGRLIGTTTSYSFLTSRNFTTSYGGWRTLRAILIFRVAAPSCFSKGRRVWFPLNLPPFFGGWHSL